MSPDLAAKIRWILKFDSEEIFKLLCAMESSTYYHCKKWPDYILSESSPCPFAYLLVFWQFNSSNNCLLRPNHLLWGGFVFPRVFRPPLNVEYTSWHEHRIRPLRLVPSLSATSFAMSSGFPRHSVCHGILSLDIGQASPPLLMTPSAAVYVIPWRNLDVMTSHNQLIISYPDSWAYNFGPWLAGNSECCTQLYGRVASLGEQRYGWPLIPVLEHMLNDLFQCQMIHHISRALRIVRLTKYDTSCSSVMDGISIPSGALGRNSKAS